MMTAEDKEVTVRSEEKDRTLFNSLDTNGIHTRLIKHPFSMLVVGVLYGVGHVSPRKAA